MPLSKDTNTTLFILANQLHRWFDMMKACGELTALFEWTDNSVPVCRRYYEQHFSFSYIGYPTKLKSLMYLTFYT